MNFILCEVCPMGAAALKSVQHTSLSSMCFIASSKKKVQFLFLVLSKKFLYKNFLVIHLAR